MFSLRIAFRYLFSKKSHNAVNIVSYISAGGICVATMALVCVLSVYNGFEKLVQGLFSEFDPDLKITLTEGKVFQISPAIDSIRTMDGVACFSPVLEENALLRNDDKQQPVVLKGVSANYEDAVNIGHLIISGNYVIERNGTPFAVAGAGLAMLNGLSTNFLNPITIYVPKRTGKVNIANPESSFRQQMLYVSGVFSVKQPEYDEKYLLVPLRLAQQLLEYDERTVSAIELKVSAGTDVKQLKANLCKMLPETFVVQDKYEQQGEFYRIMKVEKWITYLILSFILLIAVFNIIGSLSMLIIEKKEDVSIFFNMGASQRQVRWIFIWEGWLISVLGAIVGMALGILLCFVQQRFGIIHLGGADGSYIINAYPVDLQFFDLCCIFLTVLLFGFVSVLYPSRFVNR